MTIPLADYQDERHAFDLLLHSECEKRILMFWGDSGSGKTTLLDICREQAMNTLPCVNINLKGGAVNIAEIFARAGGKLGWERLSNFALQVAEFQGGTQVKIDSNWLTGINNRINVTLRVDKPDEQEQRRAALTEALFADIRTFNQPVLFILDTFEQAATEVQDWIGGPFLARVEQVKQARTLVAGQTLPDEKNIDWGYCCRTRHLLGVPEAKHWMPVVEALKKHIPFGEAETWLAGVCHALKGRPKDIMQVIERLPARQESHS